MMFSYKRPRQLTYQNNGGHGNLIYSSTTIFNEETHQNRHVPKRATQQTAIQWCPFLLNNFLFTLDTLINFLHAAINFQLNY